MGGTPPAAFGGPPLALHCAACGRLRRPPLCSTAPPSATPPLRSTAPPSATPPLRSTAPPPAAFGGPPCAPPRRLRRPPLALPRSRDLAFCFRGPRRVTVASAAVCA